MYLTRRRSGYRFQIAVPSSLHAKFGRTPFRINLGLLPAHLAQRAARLLSGHAERVFLASTMSKLGDRGMNREALSHSLAAIAAELKEIAKERHEAQMFALACNLGAEFPGFESYLQKLYDTKCDRSPMEFWTEVREKDAAAARLKRIADALRLDEAALGAMQNALGTAASDSLIALIGTLQSTVDSLSGKVDVSLEGGPTRPLLSEELDRWTTLRRGSKIGEKKVTTDYNRITDFMNFAGDRPVNKYIFSDFQSWSNLLVRVPQNHVKLPAIRHMSREQAADYNDKLPLKKQLPTLTETTIDTNYLSLSVVE